MMIKHTIVYGSMFALSFAACAGGPPRAEEGGAPLGEAAAEVATPADIEHACLHASFGPFRTVSANASYASATVNINQEHTAYNVRLPLVGSSRQGTVVYTPADGGEHAIYVNPSVPFTLFNASTNVAVPVVSQQSISSAECSALSALATYNLVGAQAYKLTYGPTAASTVLTVVENLDE